MRVGISVIITAAALLMGGCANPATPPASNTPSPAALAGLTVGQCTDAIDPHQVPSFTVVDCQGAHSWEVASLVAATGDTYPGEAALRQLADTNCGTALSDYVGVDAASTSFGVTFLAPNEALWSNPADRQVVCLVGAASGGITGSLKGTAYSFPTTGQCFGKPADGSFALDLIPCTQPHAYEVYATKKVSGKKPPTTAAFDKIYSSVCVSGFKDFVGVNAGKSKYEILYFFMPDTLWSKMGDHRIVCSAGSPAGGITGSLRDAKQ